jgi:integrase
LDTSNLSPSNSSTNAPIANASGANTRRDPLSRRTASSIRASSLSWIARTNHRTRVNSAATRRLKPPGGESAAEGAEQAIMPHRERSAAQSARVLAVAADARHEPDYRRATNGRHHPNQVMPSTKRDGGLAEHGEEGSSPARAARDGKLICAISNYGGREATCDLARNPVTAADRRPEAKRARLDFCSPEEVEALARAVAAGRHRDPRAPAVSADEAAARAAGDAHDAALVRVAAYPGLRRGELVALRLRDVDFSLRKVVVQRSVSADVEVSSTQSRRAREVPLPDQAAAALDRLSQRRDSTARDDYIRQPPGTPTRRLCPTAAPEDHRSDPHWVLAPRRVPDRGGKVRKQRISRPWGARPNQPTRQAFPRVRGFRAES